MEWREVGGWIKDNAGTGAALVGSMLSGPIPKAIAAAVSLIGSATGTTNPDAALSVLKSDPAAMLKLRELAVQEEASIREHIRAIEEARLKDAQAAHEQQQLTIRGGDNSEDPYVRRTRPMMARQSWYAAMGYIIIFELLKAVDIVDSGANWDLAMILLTPAAAYLGFRTVDKFFKK